LPILEQAEVDDVRENSKVVAMKPKSAPRVPLSHPLIERLIGTVRRKLLDQIPFWHADDLAFPRLLQ